LAFYVSRFAILISICCRQITKFWTPAWNRSCESCAPL